MVLFFSDHNKQDPWALAQLHEVFWARRWNGDDDGFFSVSRHPVSLSRDCGARTYSRAIPRTLEAAATAAGNGGWLRERCKSSHSPSQSRRRHADTHRQTCHAYAEDLPYTALLAPAHGILYTHARTKGDDDTPEKTGVYTLRLALYLLVKQTRSPPPPLSLSLSLSLSLRSARHHHGTELIAVYGVIHIQRKYSRSFAQGCLNASQHRNSPLELNHAK